MSVTEKEKVTINMKAENLAYIDGFARRTYRTRSGALDMILDLWRKEHYTDAESDNEVPSFAGSS